MRIGTVTVPRQKRFNACVADLCASFRCVLLACALILGTGPVFGNEQDAARFIEKAGAEFLAVAAPQSGNPAARTERVASFLERWTDLSRIARFTVGRTWRQMSDAQRDDYRRALRDLAARFLVKRVEHAENPGYRVVRSKEIPGNKGYLVTTELTAVDMEDAEVDWRVNGKNGQYRIVDVIMEGVSLLVTYRSEVTAVLEAEGNDIDALIANLRERSGG